MARRLLLVALAVGVSACATAVARDTGTVGPTSTTVLGVTVTVLPGATVPVTVPVPTVPLTTVPVPTVPLATVPGPTTTAAPATTAPPRPAPTKAVAPRPASPSARRGTEQPWTPFATVGGVTLHHPSSRVERVGFHESNHDGARQMEPLATAVEPVTLETRERGTGSRTAGDVVVDPDVEIRAPVTGRVKRAGTYVLYCDHSDDYVVIEPDAHPGWEVKILHIDGVLVARGDRVTAGQTVLAPRPTQLPFESQVDEVRTAEPAWPHVHVEVVDPSIPDRPSPGGGCN